MPIMSTRSQIYDDIHEQLSYTSFLGCSRLNIG